jgi:hypothetical protein
MNTDILARREAITSAALVPVFAATLFLSAGLMFLVEPMIAKMVLPRLGGSPAVWSTCLVFFQAMLLLGYLYAHLLSRAVKRPVQMGVHLLIVLPAAAVSLPLSLGAAVPPPDGWPPLWLLLHLAISVGAPAFALSATAPLLQSWFAGLDHKSAGDPYFLYAASNAGSLLALLAYPIAVEPAFRLDQQAALWSWGFGLLAAGIALSAAMAARTGLTPVRRAAAVSVPRGSLKERLLWVALAFVPSSLLLGVTAHIASDVASAPLLWVLPLAIYLATFILAFARRPKLPHALMCRVMPMVLIPVAITMVPSLFIALPVVLALHLGCLFAISMVCHGELARLRPPAARLTEFYFFLSLGGVLGGIFNALIAPVLFTGVWEYPLALVAACLLMPRTPADARPGLAGDIVLPLALLASILVVRRVFGLAAEGAHLPFMTAVFGFLVPGLVLLNFSPRRRRFAFAVAACLFAGASAGAAGTLFTARSFFGVYRIKDVEDLGQRYRLMVHGTSLHGVRGLSPGEETVPMGYYSHEGPFGAVFAALPHGSLHQVGAIGLGAGDLACYAQPGQTWTFFEIDPLVEQMARDPRWFGFLDHCGNHPKVVLGDARQTIATVPDGRYDLLIVDAFSSDSIPMHLITREALALYLRKLAPGGRLVFHISSRFLDLSPVLSVLAADAGLCTRLMAYNFPAGQSYWRHSTATVVAAARSCADISGLTQAGGWVDLPPPKNDFLWTDQRSDLLQVIRFTGR